MCIVGPKCIFYASEKAINAKIAVLCWCTVFFMICAVVAIVFWIVLEVQTARDLKEITMISSNTVKLPSGQQGIDDVQNNPAFYNGKIIYLGDVKLNSSTLIDTDFNLKLNVAVLERKTEYC